jgi:hypothetical protein
VSFAEVVRGLPGHWVANEVSGLLPYDSLPEPPSEALYSVLALDGTPLAWTQPHGQAITWFGHPSEIPRGRTSAKSR